jgi:hypothetical protein
LIKDKFEDAIAPADPESGDIGAINDILGFHIRLAHGACLRHFTETFTDLDLTQKQVSVLWLVDDHPGIAQTDLAQRLRMDRATTMAIINRLQASTSCAATVRRRTGASRRSIWSRPATRCWPAPSARSVSTKHGSKAALAIAK